MSTSANLVPVKEQEAGQRLDEVLERRLLEKITSGEMPSGMKLPPTSQMAAQMSVNSTAMQKALMRLSARGYLVRKRNSGTFVNYLDVAPPNVFLLVGHGLRDESCHFDRRLSRLVEDELISRGYNPVIYDGLNQILDRNAANGPRRTAELVAGLDYYKPKALVEQGFMSFRLPELARDGRRAVASFRPAITGGDVAFDYASFEAQAVEAAVTRGRKNAVLVLKNSDGSSEMQGLKAFWEAVRSNGLGVEKFLHIDNAVDARAREDALTEIITQELHAWKKMPERKRWDCIILSDDIQTRTVAQCLLREGISVPDDITIITLVNEGIDLSFGQPVVGIEMPLSKAASALVDLVDIRIGRSSAQDPSPILLSGRVVEIGRPIRSSLLQEVQ